MTLVHYQQHVYIRVKKTSKNLNKFRSIINARVKRPLII